MKTKRIAIAATAVALLGSQLGATSVFAAPYDIEYTGGNLLSASNVQINPTLIDSLTKLMQVRENVEVTTSNSSAINTGYLLDYKAGSGSSRCKEVKYVTVSNANPITASDGVSYTLVQDKYAVTVDFHNVSLGNADDGVTYAVGIAPGTSILYSGYQIYQDSSCRSTVSGINALNTRLNENPSKVFVDMIIKVYNKTNLNSPLILNDLYFGLTDIDRAQSYKILNEGNMLEPERMYARSAEDLQGGSDTFQNMYVSEGKYIYSEYIHNGSTGSLDTNEISNVYTKINTTTQSEGLNIVLGFATGAYNGIEYSVAPASIPETAQITYRSDENGTITGRTTEEVNVDEHPSGSSSRPITDYEFSHWIANKNVTLTNGTTIIAGNPITNAQVSAIVVQEDLILTAVHKAITPSEDEEEPNDDESEEADESVPVVPNTGKNTGNIGATITTLSIFGIILGALFIKFLPRLTHKKVNFDK